METQMHKEVLRINGFTFTQEMDLSTDTAYYKDMDGKVLMVVDSSAYAVDGTGQPLGHFALDRQTFTTWNYTSDDGRTEIITGQTLLFDKAEPFVIEKLFGPNSDLKR